MRLLIAGFVFAALAFAADPFTGTWKLNLAKSISPTFRPLPTEIIYEEQGSNAVETQKTDIAGTIKIGKFIYPLKGGPVTFIEGSPPANLSAVRSRIGDRAIEENVKRDGKVTTTIEYTLDDQARTLTVRGKGTDVQGKPYEFTGVYERQ